MKKLFLNFSLNIFYSLALFTLLPAAYAVDTRNCSKVWDDFSGGFNVANAADGNSANKWFYFSAGPFIANDGIATVKKGDDNNTLHVQASGTNPLLRTLQYPNGTPKYTKYTAPEGIDNNPSSLPGGFDHVKWLVYMNHFAQSGYPGFTAPESGRVTCHARFKGQTYYTDKHPFGMIAVPNPNDDLRLAGSAMNVIDFQSFMVFDMFVSNKTVYAFYERLPFGRGQPGFSPNYAAFSYAIPVGNRSSSNDLSNLKVAYNKKLGTVSWYLDGEKVFKVDRLGYRLDKQINPFQSRYTKKHPPIMLLDHGGVEETIIPNQIDCGMGMFTLLDGHQGSGVGLVQLSKAPDFYFPNNFQNYANAFDVRNYLWGQGSDLDLKRYKVTSPDLCSPQNNNNEDDEDD